MRLLVEAGKVDRFQDQLFRNLDCKRLQLDELWAFIAAKQKNVTPEMAAKNPSAGDVWLWVAIDADTNSFRVGRWATVISPRHIPLSMIWQAA